MLLPLNDIVTDTSIRLAASLIRDARPITVTNSFVVAEVAGRAGLRLAVAVDNYLVVAENVVARRCSWHRQARRSRRGDRRRRHRSLNVSDYPIIRAIVEDRLAIAHDFVVRQIGRGGFVSATNYFVVAGSAVAVVFLCIVETTDGASRRSVAAHYLVVTDVARRCYFMFITTDIFVTHTIVVVIYSGKGAAGL